MSLIILLIGNGGREHALAWKLAESAKVAKIYVAPGNGGTASLSKVENIEVGVSEFDKLVAFATQHDVGLVIPGPEVPLVDGIETHFRKVGIPCFGPSQLAARMEGSKAFSKDFMKRYNIPTAAYENFTDHSAAQAYLDSIHHNVVIKASGLAAGKGVIIPATKEEAKQAVKSIMVDNEFGSAGQEVVIEEFLKGEELSILAFSDGYTIRALPAAQDHKRIFDGDEGPNTGGMGCYCPIPISTPALEQKIMATILQPTIDGMRKEGMSFLGLLFTGIMLGRDGEPCVLEYNVRFGDPETQVCLPLLETDLADIMLGCVERRLDSIDFKIRQAHAATVVMVAGGYPGSYAKGEVISLPDSLEADTFLFHAGTASKDGKVVTNGGRVLAVTATAASLQEAVKKAYKGVSTISFKDAFYRKDIAHRALKRTTTTSQQPGLTYAQAGVSIDQGNALVERIKPAVRKTRRLGADSEIGGFGGTFDIEACGYKHPMLVTATDGVGTKLLIANAINKHDTVGIDLVAMSVNDLIVQGAEPLFFTDYFATSKLNVDIAAAFVEGVAAGCIESNCALVGGETAEMPDIYQGDDYDCAGAATGAVERDAMLPKFAAMQVGDVLLGLSSSGTHSNGFSLVRKIVARTGLTYDAPCPWDSTSGKSLGEALLTPTRIYVKPLLPLCQQGLIKAMSHITGGGLVENVPRMLPAHLTAEIDLKAWSVPQQFRWMKQQGGVPTSDIAKTLNMGVGMVLAVDASKAQEIRQALQGQNEMEVYTLGQLVERKEDHGCILLNESEWDF
ncbi:aminoimidazole ribonucleotide synthetase [Protomyces lactucae-debilis]|uniref:Aminoimidazole ribonucleotide synthetase n=1 Tax=Protomyces lactucae-debilis TaxID=2754530 RepID=A0A1Y2FQH3_PROLT|nr:aminoimidazole ribonucleotide synthetase [Protomyces lactucae-debilis]ORY86230.1 aminoimidazole ribonucleotide synthetase [Protomyces lactucae-debilis]